MEKLVHLLWRSADHDEVAHRRQLIDELAPALLASAAGICALEVLTGDTTADIRGRPCSSAGVRSLRRWW